MIRGLREKLTYANVMVTVLAFVVLGGVASALPGVNSVRSDDIVNRQVKRPDVANNAINGAKVANGRLAGADIADESLTGLDVKDLTGADITDGSIATADISTASLNGFMRYNTSVPSGETITGAFGTMGSPSSNDSSPGSAFQNDVISFPVPIPVPVTDANVNFAPDAIGSDDDATCTGTVAAPTAPAGKVCLYAAGSYSGTPANSIRGDGLFTSPSRFGFHVMSSTFGGPYTGAWGVWAYTAP